jgi:hypothetical protein
MPLLVGYSMIVMELDATFAKILLAMLAEGGRRIDLDEEFLARHGIVFAPEDDRVKPEDLHFWGLIDYTATGYYVTAMGRKWAQGKIGVRPIVVRDAQAPQHCQGKIGAGVRISDILNKDHNGK